MPHDSAGSPPLLDLAAAAGLAGVSARRLTRLLDDGAIASQTDPGGERHVNEDSVLAWRSLERETRRDALAALAREIGKEVFY